MDLDDLLAERAIGRALVRFGRAMDERDWGTLRTLMTTDVTAELGTGPLDGPDAIVDVIRRHLDACGPTQHLLGIPLIDVDGGAATSRCYVHDLHLGPAGRREQTFATLGDYHDRWLRGDDGEWRICHRTKLSKAWVGTLDVFTPDPPTDESL